MPVKLMMTSCQSATDIVAMHGVDKEKFTTFRPYEVDPGQLAAFRADKSGALVGERIAARYNWKPGQHVTLTELNGISFKIHGIYSTAGSAVDHVILVGRRFLQEADNQQGVSNQVLIRLKPGADPGDVCRAIDDLPLTIETSTRPEKAFMAAQLDQLADLVTASKAVIAVIVFVVLISLGNAVSMSTRERSAEFGILRSLGFQKGSILSMVLAEGVLQALIGGLIGCLLVHGLIAAQVFKSVSTCGWTITLTVGPAAWAAGMLITTAAGGLGSLVPAWNASRLEIVSAIRRED
jgi:putative ABC transport system permease protein